MGRLLWRIIPDGRNNPLFGVPGLSGWGYAACQHFSKSARYALRAPLVSTRPVGWGYLASSKG